MGPVGRWGRFGTVALAVAAVGTVVACGAVPLPRNGSSAPADPAAARQIAAADNQLGFALLNRLDASPAAGNVFLSPPSLAIDLSMLADGARGATAAQMARVLHTAGLDRGAVNAGNAALLGALRSPGKGVTLNVANSLWANGHVALLPAFLQTGSRDYGAQVRAVNFSDPATVGEINRWVDQRTSGKIPTLIHRLPANGVLMLLNAVYFQGAWQSAFNPQSTHAGTFTDGGGQAVTLPMMTQTARFPYYTGPGYQVVSLPYGDGRFSMEIAMAQPDHNLPADLGAAWTAWQQDLQPHQVAVTLPRFTLQETNSLAGPLAALGMADAFSPQADFSGLCPPQLTCTVSQVVQKTLLKVDEAGTTAAAATGIGVVTAVAVAPAAVMDINRPFLCAIVDHQTGAVLFIGQVQDPSA